METFDFPFHGTPQVTYPPRAQPVSFGGGYEFTTKPEGPPQRVFTLSFTGMQYFVDGSDNVDESVSPQRNMHAMDLFYQEHETWKRFIYPHPVYGNLTVRFQKPLEVPKGIKQGNGVVEDFTVTLIEMP